MLVKDIGRRSPFELWQCSLYQGQQVDVNQSVRGNYKTQECVRYGTYRGVPPVYTAGITGTENCGKFGTLSIPVPATSVSSVRNQ